jgi:Ca-activated chloride channel homolog
MHRTVLLFTTAGVLSLLALAAQLPRPRLASPTPAVPVSSGPGPLSLKVTPAQGLLSEVGGPTWAIVDVSTSDAPVAAQPVSLALVIDTSGSMRGEKLQQAQDAARRLVAQLHEGDELAMVSFGESARTLSRQPMSAAGRAAALAFIDGLEANGGTNLHDGLTAGARALVEARGSQRLVLVSDGRPTVGLTVSQQLAGAVSVIHERGVTVTAIGVGDDFDSALMQSLAQQGGGFSGDLRRAEALETVLALELQQARHPVARNVVLALRPSAGATVEQVAGREVTFSNDGPQVALPDLTPSQSARVLVRLAVGAGDQALTLSPQLWWTDPSGARQSRAVSLTVSRDFDEAWVSASRDEAAWADLARAFGNAQLVAAAAAIARGDQGTAFSMLEDAKRLFGTSADALAGEARELGRTEARWRAGSIDPRFEARDMTRKSLSSFGQTNSYDY